MPDYDQAKLTDEVVASFQNAPPRLREIMGALVRTPSRARST